MSEKRAMDVDDPRYRITPFQQMLASCTGAIVTSLFVTPLDVVKIRLQAQTNIPHKCFLYCNGLMDHLCSCEKTKWFQRPAHFHGTMDAFVKISRSEGLTSLWSGLAPTLVLAIPATVAYFTTYEQLRLRLKDYHNRNNNGAKQQPMWIPLVAGGTARIFSVTCVSPLELIRTKMQSTRLSYLEIGEVLRTLVRQSGVPGLWKGVTATLLRDVPFSAIYWTTYENLKSHFNITVPTFWFSFVAGAISGGIAATITVPFDVVKTHQQIAIGDKVLSGQPGKSESTYQVMRRLYGEFGIRGLCSGLVPRVIKVAPACAIMIATFEHSKIVFSRLGQKQQTRATGGEQQQSSPAAVEFQSNPFDIQGGTSREML